VQNLRSSVLISVNFVVKECSMFS
ncbi:dihydrodipicolinate reductase, family protein, partial [Vibrio parahaemolyticus V-223/04]